jgi:hypothetical protein
MQPEPEGPFYVCDVCREIVDPSDPNVVRAYEIHDVRTFGGREMIEGLASYFHRGHYPGGHGWRLDQERPDLK